MPPARIAELASIGDEVAGNITPDGLTIVFSSTRVNGGGRHAPAVGITR